MDDDAASLLRQWRSALTSVLPWRRAPHEAAAPEGGPSTGAADGFSLDQRQPLLRSGGLATDGLWPMACASVGRWRRVDLEEERSFACEQWRAGVRSYPFDGASPGARTVGGRKADFRRSTEPVLAVSADGDAIVQTACTSAMGQYVGTCDDQQLSAPGGRIGTFGAAGRRRSSGRRSCSG